MATGKINWYTTIPTNFYDFDKPGGILLRRQGGANYLAVYLMICARTANTGGRLETRLGTIVEPLSMSDIRQYLSYFSGDTLKNAMEMLQALELIDVDESGTIYVKDYDKIVGKKSDYAAQKAEQRRKKALPEASKTEDSTMDSTMDKDMDNVHTPVHTRDKSIEIRDKSIEIRDNNQDSFSPSSEYLAAAQLAERKMIAKKRRPIFAFLHERLKAEYPHVNISIGEYAAVYDLINRDSAERYFRSVENCEISGKNYRNQSHFEAMIRMAEQDDNLRMSLEEYCNEVLASIGAMA